MGINERILNILSLGVVDDVIIEAPYFIDENFLRDFNISLVVEGNLSNFDPMMSDPFEIPKALGKFQLIESGSLFTTNLLIERIRNNEEMIKNAVQRKKIKQNNYYLHEQQRKVKTVEL